MVQSWADYYVVFFNQTIIKNKMLDTIKNLFGFGTPTNYSDLVHQGALIVDVRSQQEFASGHIENAINLPVDSLKQQLQKLPNKNQIIITCCASGMRSGVAKTILISNGYSSVYNGGGWTSLQSKLK